MIIKLIIVNYKKMIAMNRFILPTIHIKILSPFIRMSKF